MATGIVVHHSACPSINGKGYDFYVTRTGFVIPGAEPTEPGGRIHVCLEGDFSRYDGTDPDTEEQLFVAAKLISRLADALGFSTAAMYRHEAHCPGERFPWAKLVISISDGYH
ncbi:hypothetical protein [Paenibacillus sp.]|uniref:hypothetical protein n=1 Tax=Paenibacillus sp. TaxID=58172 RepID=UPI002D4031BD|nr:hypothetical protein [Paenibacillus sp.]HZG85199.1 hypothetical protein [Paenibacillus sp.]